MKRKNVTHYWLMMQYAEQDAFLDDSVCGRQWDNSDITNSQQKVTCKLCIDWLDAKKHFR